MLRKINVYNLKNFFVIMCTYWYTFSVSHNIIVTKIKDYILEIKKRHKKSLVYFEK